MIVSLRPLVVIPRAILRPVRIVWRARRVQRYQSPDAREAKPRVGFFQAYQEMLEHQAELMIKPFDG